MTDWIRQKHDAAAERVRKALALPDPEHKDDIGDIDFFDPWELFPCLYGVYSGAFDACAIDVLCEIRDGARNRDDLGADMFREMLCTADLCEYGTSPRVCFPTQQFKVHLPELIQRWRGYAQLKWGDDVTEAQ
jgi:hypothetical protein